MIVIDGISLLFMSGGIKSYLIAFLKALNSSEEAKKNTYTILIPQIDPKNTALQYTDVKELEDTLDVRFTFKYIKINPIVFKFYSALNLSNPSIRRYTIFIWENYYLPRCIKKLKPDVIFHPYQLISNYKTSARKVVVVHDIFHWIENKDSAWWDKKLYDTYKNGCIQADMIVTISETSKKEIVDYFQVDEKKVVVCYEGVDDMFLSFRPSPETAKKLVAQYKLPKKYLFSLATVRKYKNMKGLLQVFTLLSEEDPELHLVLVGWPSAFNDDMKKYITDHHLEAKVSMFSNISTEQLCYIYYLSYAFLFLSLKEGFGLPPLEAISCHTLAIVSNVSAIGEMYNTILPSFDPHDYTSISEYILQLTPTKRSQAIASAHAKLLPKYSWKQVLPKYLACFS